MYVYGKARSYEEIEWLGWTDDHDAAIAEAESHKQRYCDGVVMTLAPDGVLSTEVYSRVPKPHTGPLARARVNYMNSPGGAHRIPVDCARPYLADLTEDEPWRVIATEVMPSLDAPEPGDFGACRCGAWQEIEGEPNAVAEMVRKYPLAR